MEGVAVGVVISIITSACSCECCEIDPETPSPVNGGCAQE